MIGAWFAVIVLAVLLVARHEPAAAQSDPERLNASLRFLAIAFAMAFTLSPYAGPRDTMFGHNLTNDSGESYAEVVAYVARLNGKVISPDDPTILIQANKPPSRSIFTDEDALGWPAVLPPAVVRDLSQADYLVHDAGWGREWLHSDSIAALGYTMQWSNGAYSVWKKNVTAPVSVLPTPAAASSN